MPIDDWQFWMVTILALLAAGFILRPLIPSTRRKSGCGSCPKETSSKKTRATLTIDGERVR